jgi:hypothetical protein
MSEADENNLGQSLARVARPQDGRSGGRAAPDLVMVSAMALSWPDATRNASESADPRSIGWTLKKVQTLSSTASTSRGRAGEMDAGAVHRRVNE